MLSLAQNKSLLTLSPLQKWSHTKSSNLYLLNSCTGLLRRAQGRDPGCREAGGRKRGPKYCIIVSSPREEVPKYKRSGELHHPQTRKQPYIYHELPENKNTVSISVQLIRSTVTPSRP